MTVSIPTDRKALEAELIAQRNYIHALQQALPVGVCAVDAQGRVKSLNPEGERLLGWGEIACTGAILHELIGCRMESGDTDEDMCPVTEAIHTGKPAWATHTIIRCRNGTLKPVEYKCIPLSACRDLGALFCFRDLSNQLQLEKDLLRLASMPEESPNPIVELDADANLIYANTMMVALVEQFGFNAEGFPAILPDDVARVAQKCLASDEVMKGIEAIPGDKHYEWTFFPMPEIGMLRGYGVDLTERKQAEQELRRARDAAINASRVKSEFLANVSHELRTPLNGIIGMTELTLSLELSAEQREYLGMVRESAATLLALINDILDFSKVEAGKLSLEPLPFALRSSLDEMVKALTLRAQQKGLEFLCEIEPEVPDALVGDPGRLRQVIVNLVDNAIKFTAHGKIVVSVKIEAPAQNEVCLHFAVADTGSGIPAEKQRIIFEPFVQADGSTTRTHGGTGLGLAIVTELVEMMQGQVWVESAGPGTGSTFYFTVRFGVQPPQVTSSLPTMYSNGPSAHKFSRVRPAPEGDEEPHSLHILLAEDNAINQKLALRLLEKRGHTVVVADNGKEALALLAQQPFDLILMDVQMPEMDGIKATAAIRAQEQAHGTHIPIIAMTAHAMQGDRERCLEVGMDDYLTKPIQPEKLFAALESLFQPPAETAITIGSVSPTDEVFDQIALLVRLDGDEALMQELLGLFLEDYPQRLTHLREALASHDGQALVQAAHTFKGAVSNLCAKGTFEMARRLEALARAGDLQQAADTYGNLEKEVRRLETVLAPLVKVKVQ